MMQLSLEYSEARVVLTGPAPYSGPRESVAFLKSSLYDNVSGKGFERRTFWAGCVAGLHLLVAGLTT